MWFMPEPLIPSTPGPNPPILPLHCSKQIFTVHCSFCLCASAFMLWWPLLCCHKVLYGTFAMASIGAACTVPACMLFWIVPFGHSCMFPFHFVYSNLDGHHISAEQYQENYTEALADREKKMLNCISLFFPFSIASLCCFLGVCVAERVCGCIMCSSDLILAEYKERGVTVFILSG